MQQLTEKRHQVKNYFQTIRNLREMVLGDWAPIPHQMVTYADEYPTSQYVRRYSGPTFSEGAAVVPGSENGELGM